MGTVSWARHRGGQQERGGIWLHIPGPSFPLLHNGDEIQTLLMWWWGLGSGNARPYCCSSKGTTLVQPPGPESRSFITLPWHITISPLAQGPNEEGTVAVGPQGTRLAPKATEQGHEALWGTVAGVSFLGVH